MKPFLDELSAYLSEVTTTPGDLIIEGYFNLRYEQADAAGVDGFKELLAETTYNSMCHNRHIE